jgi:hypothetical protein
MNRFALAMLVGFVVLLMLSIIVFTFSKCGTKTFFLGNGATYAAATGMCDE